MLKGKLTVITGPMGCGKTLELIVRLKKEEIKGRKVECFKPSVDTREATDVTSSRIGLTIPVIKVKNASQLKDTVLAHHDEMEVIGIDEAQLFPVDNYCLSEVVSDLVSSGYDVYASGLNQDFKGRPFGAAMVHLMMAADDVVHMKSICAVCGCEHASKTQRLDGSGMPVVDGSTIQIGGNDSYQARCHKCWVSS